MRRTDDRLMPILAVIFRLLVPGANSARIRSACWRIVAGPVLPRAFELITGLLSSM
jgi:hypothetical protein